MKKINEEPRVEQEIVEIKGEMLESHVAIKALYGVLLIVILLSIGTIFYSTIEKWSIVDSLFFSAYTITTIGYGNLIPSSDFSKLFTIGYMFIGVGVALYVLSSMAAEILKRREMEWLGQARKGRLKHIGHLGKHIKQAAGKFKYDKEDVGNSYKHHEDEEEK
ncbi:MAG: potassium channel family protein [Nanoarchaeota archaeon]